LVNLTKSGVLNSYTAAINGGAVDFTATTLGNVTDLVKTGSAGGAFAVVDGTSPVAGTPAATEVVRFDFTGTPVVGEVVTFKSPAGLVAENLTYTVIAGDTAASVAAAFAAQFTPALLTGATSWGLYASAVATGNSLTLTGDANTAINNPTAATVATNTPAGFATGVAVSSAESDNTIDLGAGNDVAVLGTGANSNDTIVFTGYNLGKNTIVNFEDAAASTGRDLLDFNAYLNGKSSASGSVESQREIDIELTGAGVANVKANSVTVLNGVFTATDTFAGLTAEKLLAAVNSTNTGATNYAGINASTLDAVNNYTANTLVGGVGKAVVLVQNNGNEGEYLAFELSFNATATNTTKDFTAAQLIGTVDFGNSVDFTSVLAA
jgi:hypothetical protein